MPGGTSDEDDADAPLVLERRGSRVVIATAVAVVAALVGLLAVGTGDDDAAPPVTTVPPSTTAQAMPDDPGLVRLAGADDLDEPIWLLAGRSPTENAMQLHRVDGIGGRRINAAAGQGQTPGVPFRAIRAGDAIVWSNGDNLFRVDDDLTLVPFALGAATAVFASDDERVWTVDGDNFIVDSPLTPDRQPERLGELDGELVAPLSGGPVLLRAEGGVGLWAPGLQPSYVGDELLDTTSEQTLLSGRRDGRGVIVSAQTSPFAVTATVPLDVDGVPLGHGALSPDGARLAFHLQRGERIELVVSDLVDGTTTPLGIFTDRSAPVWLGDDRLVAIGAPNDDRHVVWLVAPGTDEPSIPILDLDADRAWTLATPTR